MRLMIWSDPPIILLKPPSGYSKVCSKIAEGILEKHMVAWTPMGESFNLGPLKLGDLYVYPSGNTRFGEDVILDNCLHFNADVVFVMKDPFFMERAHGYPLELIWYLPVDHEDLHPHIDLVLKTAFKIVACSEFGRRELEKKKHKVDAVIPHGVDLSVYRPMWGVNRGNCKRFFGLDPYGFHVGFIGMNRPRKMVWRILQVFARISELEPDIKFLLWTNVSREIPLLHEMAHLGLTDKVYWPTLKTYNAGIPEGLMWRWYNACDVVICVSGEGFWLPGIEAMACGIPTVSVDYAAAAEIAQFKAKVKDFVWGNQAGVKQPLVDIDDMAKRIIRIYNSDWERLRNRQLRKAKKYDWKKIIPLWLRFFEDCEIELKPLIKKGGIEKWDQKTE